jgi:cell division protein FtsN
MPKDYKHRVGSQRKRQPISPWVGVMAGLLIGLFVAFLVYLKLQAPATNPKLILEGGTAPVATAPEPAAEVPASSEEPARPGPPKPRFDFYTLLPEMEVVIPEEEVNAKVEAHARAQEAARTVTPSVETPDIQPVETADTYFLQVGSFRNGEQAERFKAELALLGLETNIQKVTINNRDTWHRVRVGPFNSLDALDRARKLLGGQGIESTTIKIKG